MRFWPQFGCVNPKNSSNPSYPSQFLVWHIHRQLNNEHCDQVLLLMKFCQCQTFWGRILQCGFPYYDCQVKKPKTFQDKPWLKLMLETLFASHHFSSMYECSSLSQHVTNWRGTIKLQTACSCVCPFLTSLDCCTVIDIDDK